MSNHPQNATAGARGFLSAKAAFLLAVGYATFNQIGRPYLNLNLGQPWSWVELGAVFAILTMLGWQLFPRMKAALAALLSAGGGAVELAQHVRLAPGVGSVSDMAAEVAGIAFASALMAILLAARSSPERRPRALNLTSRNAR